MSEEKKVHIGPKGPRKCRARTRPCKYDHFDSMEAAETEYLKRLEDANKNAMDSQRKSSEKGGRRRSKKGTDISNFVVPARAYPKEISTLEEAVEYSMKEAEKPDPYPYTLRNRLEDEELRSIKRDLGVTSTRYTSVSVSEMGRGNYEVGLEIDYKDPDVKRIMAKAEAEGYKTDVMFWDEWEDDENMNPEPRGILIMRPASERVVEAERARETWILHKMVVNRLRDGVARDKLFPSKPSE